jgi:hypothetical protein
MDSKGLLPRSLSNSPASVRVFRNTTCVHKQLQMNPTQPQTNATTLQHHATAQDVSPHNRDAYVGRQAHPFYSLSRSQASVRVPFFLQSPTHKIRD